jgi:transposase
MSKKKKNDLAFKLECIRAYDEQGLGFKAIGKLYDVNPSQIQLWYSFYQCYGVQGIEQRTYTSYSTSFKLKVIKYLKSNLISLKDACVKFNISRESVIISWQRAYAQNGAEGLISQPKGRKVIMENSNKKRSAKESKPLTREEELLQENEYLRTELAFLKKLRALAQNGKKPKP